MAIALLEVENMLKKKRFIGMACSLLLLTACQSNESNDPDSATDESIEENNEQVEPNQENNDSEEESKESKSEESESEESESEESENTEQENQENTAADENSSEDSVSEKVKEEEYASEEEAIAAIEDYQVVEQTNTDLGYGIEALSEGATGHQYISWNEGNWLIKIDFPLDPQYAVEEYEDGQSMAETVVEYLEDHILPPPSERGVIQITAFKDHPETNIRWQEGSTVYEINQDTNDPIDTLQIAVDYQENKE